MTTDLNEHEAARTPIPAADDGAALVAPPQGVVDGGQQVGPSGGRMGRRMRALPGLGLALVAGAIAFGVSKLVPSMSPLLVAIVLGAVLANTVGVSARFEAGLAIAAKRLLRIGVALLGLQLALPDVLALGWPVIGVVVAVVGLGIAGSLFIGALLGLSRTQRLLIACGFSICGAAAAAAVDGVIDAEEEELVTTIALVVIFGTLMIPLVPLLSGLLGLDSTTAGLWAGASIHEVAQVVASAGIIGGGALAVAVVVKLARVLMLAPVLAIIGLRQRRVDAAARADGASVDVSDRRRPPLVPLFVIGFIAFLALRSTGAVPAAVLSVGASLETLLLAMAMFALGAAVRVAGLRKVGLRPFAMAAVSTVWVAALALTGILLVA